MFVSSLFEYEPKKIVMRNCQSALASGLSSESE
jgi:hypothetical protein